MFAHVSYFHPCLIFAGKAGAYHIVPQANDSLIDKPTNIRLGRTGANTVAYYNMTIIIALKVL
jgi:hypothetical protein